ncbi:ABC transporter substrate-binding protein [uncultured Cohaesibacter sp.]|uniref:ABC transporter substrate-binding protein n=1 Tax=uncultured Cohaesibacter sp. TaxID=1002546 RepID=UPI0037483169
MKKWALLASVLALGAMSSAAQARDLTITSWGGSYQTAQQDIYFKPFSEKVGKPVLDESWDGGYGVLQAKVKAGAPNWDAVQVEAEELALGCDDGIFEMIDWDKMGGEDAFMPAAVSDCGVGTIVWSLALAYDGNKLSDGPKNWADFWDVKKFPGKRALRKGAKYTLEFALLADGVPADELYDVLSTPEGIDRAFAKLDELKPDLVWWESGAQPLQFLASGEVAMAASYNGRITSINKTEGKNFKIVWPGSIYAVDSWVILKDAENKELAQDFIAFASQPENMAKLPEYIAYGLTNKEASSMVPDEYKADVPTTPENLEEALSLNIDFWIDNSEALNQRFNAWLAQ